MAFIEAFIRNLRVMSNDVLMTLRPNLRIVTGRAIVTDESGYNATQLDLTSIENQADTLESDLSDAQDDISTLQSQVTGILSGGVSPTVVWQPGGATSGNTYTDLATAIAAAKAASAGVVRVVLDDSAGSLVLPTAVIDLEKRVEFYADHDVTVTVGNTASFTNPAATRTAPGARITWDITGSVGSALFVIDGTYDRQALFEGSTFVLTSGSRRHIDSTGLTAFSVRFERSEVSNFAGASVVAEIGDGVTFSSDPFTLSANLTLTYVNGSPHPSSLASVTGTATQSRPFEGRTVFLSPPDTGTTMDPAPAGSPVGGAGTAITITATTASLFRHWWVPSGVTRSFERCAVEVPAGATRLAVYLHVSGTTSSASAAVIDLAFRVASGTWGTKRSVNVVSVDTTQATRVLAHDGPLSDWSLSTADPSKLVKALDVGRDGVSDPATWGVYLHAIELVWA